MVTNRGHRPTIYLQESCLKHQYIRSRDTSNVVERPERLRAVHLGLAAAIARLEQEAQDRPLQGDTTPVPSSKQVLDPDDLAAAIGRLDIEGEGTNDASGISTIINIVKSNAKADILNNPAVKHIHGDIDGDVYLENLAKWVANCTENIQNLGSEVPEGYAQGDLYLCPESLEAIQGALGTVCEAVDSVIAASRGGASSSTSSSRAFVAVRPPGHHCGEDSPSGFCFVNNVAVGAAHAHLKYGINRVVIFDIDLHHGNGTQSIVWQINEEAYREQLELEAGAPPKEGGLLRVYYGSAHDILSYPCEDGKLELVQAASASIHEAHGQYIENVHLAPYKSEEQFWEELYDKQYGKLLRTATGFLEGTGGAGDDTLIFISCGMDACEHEYSSMQRHGRKVPTSLYYRFTQDACRLSEKFAQRRIISVLEGGYSDRALISGAMAHICGFFANPDDEELRRKEWWRVENLEKIEKLLKKRRGGRASLGGPSLNEPWLERTQDIFQKIDSPIPKPALPPAPKRNLRGTKAGGTTTTTPDPSPGRPKRTTATASSPAASPSKPARKVKVKQPEENKSPSPPHIPLEGLPNVIPATNVGIGIDDKLFAQPGEDVAKVGMAKTGSGETSPITVAKRLPKVKLKLGPHPKTVKQEGSGED